LNLWNWPHKKDVITIYCLYGLCVALFHCVDLKNVEEEVSDTNFLYIDM